MNTPDMQKIESDITFLREAVETRNNQQYASITIAILWAVIVAAGSIVNDFFTHLAGWYWLIAPILGFVISLIIGQRDARSGGVASSRDMYQHAFHWGSIFVAFAAILIIAHTNGFTGKTVGQLALLTSGMGGFLAGLHLDRRFLFPGLVIMLGAPIIDYVQPYPWTTVGLAFSASLIISTVLLRPKHEQNQ